MWIDARLRRSVQKTLSGLGLAVCVALALLSADLGNALAQEPSEPGAAPAAGPGVPAQVDLDQLLKLPRAARYGVERRGGYTRGEWQERFVAAHAAVDEAREELEASQQELEQLSSKTGQWLYQPPGSQASSESPLSYKLTQQIRRQREAVEQAEHELQELEIQANLASVPEAWRAPAEAEAEGTQDAPPEALDARSDRR